MWGKTIIYIPNFKKGVEGSGWLGKIPIICVDPFYHSYYKLNNQYHFCWIITIPKFDN